MADTCIVDSNTVDLGFTTGGELEADVRLRTVSAGSITDDADGIGVALYSAGGLQHTASGASMKVTSQGLHVGAEGLMKVQGYAVSGASVVSNATNPNAALARGVNVQYGSTLSLTGSFPSNEVVSYIYVHARWRGRWTTNLTAFGGQLLDSVFAYLQVNTDGAGWGTIDQASIEYANMSGSFALDGWHNFAMANGTSHTVQSRLLVGGGTTTGSGTQGVLYTEYGGCLEWFY